MPTKRCTMGYAVVGSNIYIMGGTDNGGVRGEVEIYDTVNNRWSTGTPMPVKVNGFACVAVGDKVYAFGGITDSNTMKSTDAVQIYNTESRVWESGSAMPIAKGGFASLVIGNEIYLMGGATYTPYTIYKTVHIYNTLNKTWTEGVSLPEPRVSPRAVYIDGSIYLVGGHTDYPTQKYIKSVLTLKKKRSNGLKVLLNVGEKIQLSTSFDLNNNKKFKWHSDDEEAAIVDSGGKVTAVGVGNAEIYAESTDGNFRDRIAVKVVDGIADELRLAVHLKEGEKAMLFLTDDPTKVIWKSLDAKIVDVSTEGQLTGIKKGLAIVRAELDGETYQIYVRVNG